MKRIGQSAAGNIGSTPTGASGQLTRSIGTGEAL